MAENVEKACPGLIIGSVCGLSNAGDTRESAQPLPPSVVELRLRNHTQSSRNLSLTAELTPVPAPHGCLVFRYMRTSSERLPLNL